MARTLDVVGDWWSLLIVRDALHGKRRFGEFERSLGLAKNILAGRLRTLVQHGILDTVPASDGGTYREYVLTEKGEALYPVLVALRQWGERYLFDPGELGQRLVDQERGEPIAALELRSRDGRRLGPADVRLAPSAGEGRA